MQIPQIIVGLEDVNANVAIEKMHTTYIFSFLAQGNSQKRKGGRVVGYTKRNPGRRALFLHAVDAIRKAYPEALIVEYRGGAGHQRQSIACTNTENPSALFVDTEIKYRSKHKLSLAVHIPSAPELDELRSALKLSDKKHRAVKLWNGPFRIG